MLKISAPASSANIGPGFDSIGMAVDLDLILKIQQADEWKFTHATKLIPPVRNYKDHYIYKVAHKIAKLHGKTLPASHVTMYSDIPLARGLGSSSSAIIVGIELANQLCNLNLTKTEKLNYAVDIEGHPDNVAPALFGGIVISVKLGKQVHYKKVPSINCDTVIYIPQFKLKTEDARKVLPEQLPLSHATSASAVANLMVSALLTEDFELAGQMMENDLFHEQYRSQLIPNYNKIKETARDFGAYGTVISGAGPTMISFVPKGLGQDVTNKMKQKLPEYTVKNISINNVGLQVTKK